MSLLFQLNPGHSNNEGRNSNTRSATPPPTTSLDHDTRGDSPPPVPPHGTHAMVPSASAVDRPQLVLNIVQAEGGDEMGGGVVGGGNESGHSDTIEGFRFTSPIQGGYLSRYCLVRL